jgi:hypothetical protein
MISAEFSFDNCVKMLLKKFANAAFLSTPGSFTFALAISILTSSTEALSLLRPI